MEDYLVYYLKLYQEAFAGPDNPHSGMKFAPLKPREKLKIAYQFLEEAKLRGEKIKFGDFKLITRYSSTFDEEGWCISDKNKSFHLDENNKIRADPFDEMIRHQVYKLLKYKGSFYSMIKS